MVYRIGLLMNQVQVCQRSIRIFDSADKTISILAGPWLH